MNCTGWYLIFVTLIGVSVKQFPVYGLQELIQKAGNLPEYIAPDNNSLRAPDYLSAYRATSRTWLSTLLPTLASTDDLVQETELLLRTVVKERELSGYGYRHVVKLFPHNGDTLFVWSSLQSGFHTFIRALSHLQQDNILREDLSLTADNYYFVFNGNAMGVAPYNLELLSAILQLMIKNPHNVFYIAGPNEDRELWIDQGLLRQVGAIVGLEGAKFATGSSLARFKELENLFIRFFNSLPLALYIDYATKDTHSIIQLSALDPQSPELNYKNFGDFFERPFYEGGRYYTTYRVAHTIPTTGSIQREVLITTPNLMKQFTPTTGLIHTNNNKGLSVWNLFSGQIKLYRDVDNFIYDAYAKITLHDSISASTIQLINRNIYTNAPFARSTSSSLLSNSLLTGGTTAP